MPGPTTDFTYDLTTPVGQTRFHLADTTNTQESPSIWGDSEIAYTLTVTALNPELAAARCLRAAAADQARLAVITKRGSRGNDQSEVYAALLKVALTLEERALVTPVASVYDQVFSMTSGGGTTPGSMDTW